MNERRGKREKNTEKAKKTRSLWKDPLQLYLPMQKEVEDARLAGVECPSMVKG